MIAEHDERLIQDVLEGEATVAQIADHKRLMETSVEFRARHEEMGEVFRQLSASPAVGPPAGMHDDIVRAIAAESRASAPRPAGVRRRGLTPVLGAFLAGAAAAALIVVSVMRGPGASRFSGGAQVSGTMAPVESALGTVLSRGSIDAGGGRIDLVTRRAGPEAWLEVRTRLVRPVDVEIVFPADGLGVTGARWSGPPAGRLTVNAGHVVLGGMTSGDLVLTFIARGASDAPVQVRVDGASSVLLHTAPQP